MIFSAQIKQFAEEVDRRARAVHLGVVQRTYASIVEGSALTGAPGQPVDTGNLKTSWQVIMETPLRSQIVTNVIYAPQIEEGARDGRALTLRSEVGGFHSVALTRAAWPRIVEAATIEAVGVARDA